MGRADASYHAGAVSEGTVAEASVAVTQLLAAAEAYVSPHLPPYLD